MKQLVISIVAVAALTLATGCEAEGAEQNYNKTAPGAGTAAVGGGGSGGAGGGAAGGECEAFTCGMNDAVMMGGAKFCGEDGIAGFLPPACEADDTCPNLMGSTCMQAGMTKGCVKTCT